MKQKFLFIYALVPTVLLGSSLSIYRNPILVNGEDNKTIFDCSATSDTLTMTGSEALNTILKSTSETVSISIAEKEYLDSNFEVKYDKNTNTKYNLAYLDGYYWIEVFAQSNYVPQYLLVTKNNVEERVDFKSLNNQLIAQVEDFDSAKIVYKYTFDLDVSKVNELLTSAYRLGKEESEKSVFNKNYDEQLQEYLEYTEKLAIYNEYLQNKSAYDLAKANYDKYVQDLKQYTEIDLPAYQNYLVEKETYLENLEKYNHYIENAGMIAQNKEVYDEAIEAYNNSMKTINSQLEIMDFIYENHGDLDLSIDYFINTGAVDTVIERRSEIVTAGVSGAAIDLAKEKTELLKSLINGYKEIIDGEKKDKYVWYQSHFNSLKNAVTQLTGCLEYFYSIGIVRSAIEDKQRTDKYLLLVAELIYFSELLNENGVPSYNGAYTLDKNTKIGGIAKTYPEYIGYGTIDINIDAIPLVGSYPTVPSGAVIIEIDPVEKPIEPKVVKMPIEPEFVENPGTLDPVEKPSKVDTPAGEKKILNENLSALLEAYDLGLLEERNEFDNDFTFEITDEVSLEKSNAKELVVLFDTRNGHIPTLARLKEFAFFSDSNDFSLRTVPAESYGYKTTNETLTSELISAQTYGEPTDLSEQNLSLLIEKLNDALASYKVNWNHVVYNESGENFVSLDRTVDNLAYEFMEPKYNEDGSNPKQRDYYFKGSRRYTYEFIGFDYTNEVDETENLLSGLVNTDEIASYQEADNEININVVFRKINCYDVKFDGKVNNYKVGTMINAPTTNPTKESTSKRRFEFAGWGLDGSKTPTEFPFELTKDVEFSPLWNEIELYDASFVVDGKTVDTQKLDEGSIPVTPLAETISKQSNGNTYYEFSGWDKTVSALDEDTIYNATFEEHQIFENATFTETKNNVSVKLENTNVIDLTNYVRLISKNELTVKPITFILDDVEFSFDVSQINYILTLNPKSIEFIKNNGENKDIFVSLVLKDDNNQVINTSVLTTNVLLKNISEISHVKLFNQNNKVPFESTSRTSLKSSLKIGTQYTISYFYTVSFDKYMSAVTFKVNGQTINPGKEFELKSGESLQVEAVANNGINLLSLYASKNDGSKINITNKTLTVSDEDLIVHADIEHIIYTINLYVGDSLYQSIKSTYGAFINLPSNISKPSDDTYSYVFVGWDQEITTVDGNYDLHAVFEAIELNPTKEEEEEKTNGLTFGQKVGISILAIVAGVIGIGIVIVITKLRKKPLKK